MSLENRSQQNKAQWGGLGAPLAAKTDNYRPRAPFPLNLSQPDSEMGNNDFSNRWGVQRGRGVMVVRRLVGARWGARHREGVLLPGGSAQGRDHDSLGLALSSAPVGAAGRLWPVPASPGSPPGLSSPVAFAALLLQAAPGLISFAVTLFRAAPGIELADGVPCAPPPGSTPGLRSPAAPPPSSPRALPPPVPAPPAPPRVSRPLQLAGSALRGPGAGREPQLLRRARRTKERNAGGAREEGERRRAQPPGHSEEGARRARSPPLRGARPPKAPRAAAAGAGPAPRTPRPAPLSAPSTPPHPRRRACSSGSPRRIWAGTTRTSPPRLTRTRKVSGGGRRPGPSLRHQ